jgi:hypothetical protein
VDDEGTGKVYRFGLRIAKEDSALDGAPSLLGRDIMKGWKILCDFPNKKLEISIQMSDDEIKLKK